MKTLREDQSEALDKLRQAVTSGKRRIIMQAPVGFGKTVLAAGLVESARKKNKRVLFTVPAISLIDQTVEMFYAQGIHEIGVIQANHHMTDWSQPVQIASIQTLQNRTLPKADVVLVDEQHRWSKLYEKWFRDPEWKNIPIIGLSATPWTRGLGAYFEELIVATTTQKLIDNGLLAPPRVFAPSHPDLKGVRTVAGDYHETELGDRMSKPELVADIVETWLKRAEGRPTLCFAVNRVHAKHIQQQFEAAGVTCGYQDANTSGPDRTEIKKKFHNGDYKVVANIGTLCLDQETEILTDSGWVGIDKMTYDHRVAAWSEGGTEFTNPLHIVRRHRKLDEKMVCIEGRKQNVRVTSNHRMLWSNSRHGGFKITSAESIVDKIGFIPVSGHAAPKIYNISSNDDRSQKRKNALTYRYRNQGMTAQQAVVAEQEYREHLVVNCSPKKPYELSLDECYFIGFWIGDGTRYGGRFSVSQSRRYQKIIEWFDGLVGRLGLHFTKSVYPPASKSSNDSVRWNFSTGRGGRGQSVVGGVAPLMDYLQKDGSDLFWGLNDEQFGALLHGYWLADGNHGDGDGEGNGRRISGRSLRLFDLLQAIGACRGHRISITRDNGKHRKTPFYRITWLKQTVSKLMRERFQLEGDYKLERVWCVTSTTGNIITRRRGKVVVVGNTTGIDWDVRCISMCRPTKSAMLFCQVIGRGLRTAEGKTDCLVLDHSDNHLRLGFIADVEESFTGLHNGTTPQEQKVDGIRLPKECPQCSYLKPPKVAVCPNCGFVAKAKTDVKVANGELKEITRKKKMPVSGDKTDVYAGLLWIAKKYGYRDGWVAHKYRVIFGVWPKGLSYIPPKEPTGDLQKWVRSQQVRYAKRRRETEEKENIDVANPALTVREQSIIDNVGKQFVPGTLCTQEDMDVKW